MKRIKSTSPRGYDLAFPLSEDYLIVCQIYEISENYLASGSEQIALKCDLDDEALLTMTLTERIAKALKEKKIDAIGGLKADKHGEISVLC